MVLYTDLLFDVDDTLLQFKKGEEAALRTIFADYGVDYADGFETFRTISSALWQAAEAGEITVPMILETRFTKWLDAYQLEGDGVALDERFRSLLAADDYSFDGAYDMLRRLERHHRLSIVTNGVGNTQDARLKRSNLDSFFAYRFVSSEIGVQKPDERFFEAVNETIPEFQAERALVIGDSLTSDMEGARRAGIPSCWFNPERALIPNQPIDYIIHDYADLERLVTWQEPVRIRIDHYQLEEERIYVGDRSMIDDLMWLEGWHAVEKELHALGFLRTTKPAHFVLDFDTQLKYVLHT